jgi:outer membrane biosynthesis protein TonB
VLLEGRIGVDGFINDLRVVTQGNVEFAAAAVEAVRQWEFSQTLLDGVPVEVKMNISVTFRGAQ